MITYAERENPWQGVLRGKEHVCFLVKLKYIMSGFHLFLHQRVFEDLTLCVFRSLGTDIPIYVLHQPLSYENNFQVTS